MLSLFMVFIEQKVIITNQRCLDVEMKGNPNEMKEHENFDYMTIRKLDINKEEDKQLVNGYWTNKLIKLKECR